MSTYYSFVTEPTSNEEIIKEVEAALTEMGINYVKCQAFSLVSFAGLYKNLGGGFYEATKIPVKLAWVSDEDGHGISE